MDGQSGSPRPWLISTVEPAAPAAGVWGQVDSAALAANVAVLLVLAGAHVLVFEALPERLSVGRRLGALPRLDLPVDAQVTRGAGYLHHVRRWQTVLGRAGIGRYLLPTAPGLLDVLRVAPNALGEISSTGPATVRHIIEDLGYDYILLRGVDGTALPAADLLHGLVDRRLVFFAPDPSAAREAGVAAGSGRDAPVGPDAIVAVTTDSPDNLSWRPGAGEALGAQFVSGLSAGTGHRETSGPAPAPVEVLRVPEPGHRPGTPLLTVLRAALPPDGYREAARRITAGRSSPGPVPSALVRRYRRRTGDAGPGSPERVWLARSPADGPWGRWIAEELERRGARITEVRGDGALLADRGPALLLLVGPVDALPGPVRDEVAAVLGPAADPGPAPEFDVVRALIPGSAEAGAGERAPDEDAVGPAVGRVLDLRTVEESAATALVAGQLLTPEPVTGGPMTGRRWVIRFPGAPVPRQEVNFTPSGGGPQGGGPVGREAELDALRAGLVEHGTVVVAGAWGVGKRELVSAYTRAYGFDYDVIWWVPAFDRVAAAVSRQRLRDRLARDQPAAARAWDGGPPDQPREGTGPRWLLVYTYPAHSEQLAELVPPAGIGHVVIIAPGTDAAGSAPGGPAGADTMHLDRLPPAREWPVRPGARLLTLAGLPDRLGAVLLAGELPASAVSAAERVCRSLGGLPLSLLLAGALLRVERAGGRPVSVAGGPGPAEPSGGSSDVDDPAAGGELVAWLRELVRRLDRAPEDGGAKPPPAGLEPAHASAVELLGLLCDGLAALSAEGRLTLLLARVCAFLCPTGVSLRLLYRAPVVEQLCELAGPADAAALAEDPLAMQRLIAFGRQCALFTVTGDPGTLRVHTLIQRGLRVLLPDDQRDAIRAATQRMLARCAPTEAEVELERHEEIQDELGRHLTVSGATASPDVEVCAWVVRQLRFTARYETTVQRRAALQAAGELERRWLEGTPAHAAGLVARLHAARAALHYALDQRAEAIDAQQRAYQAAAARDGRRHPRTLLALRSLARYQGGNGLFREAHATSNSVYRGLVQTLGPDNPNTLWAGSALAFYTFLTGAVASAISQQRRILGYWVGASGWGGKQTWLEAVNLGIFMYEWGDLRQAREYLDQAERAVRDSGRSGEVPVGKLLLLRRFRAAVDRAAGKSEEVRRALSDVLDGYRREFGPGAPDTLACQLSLAAAEHTADRLVEAAERASTVAAPLERGLPDGHPYLYLGLTDLAVFLAGGGALDRARAAGERAVLGLTRSLGPIHPWTLAARINQLATAGAPADPRALAALAERCRRALTSAHPYSATAAANARDPSLNATIIIDIPQT